jgi:hypothetical protein
VPDPASLHGLALALSVLAVLLVFALRAGIATTLGVCAGAALLWLQFAPL